MGILWCAATRDGQPCAPAESIESDEEIPSVIRRRSDTQPPPSPTDSRLRDLHKENMERVKTNDYNQLRRESMVSSSVKEGGKLVRLVRNRRTKSAPQMPSCKVSDASDEEFLNRKAVMKKQIKDVLKPYLFVNELCRLDREVETLCDGLLTNTFSDGPISNQMDETKSYLGESSSVRTYNRESYNIDRSFERSTPATSDPQEVILITNESVGDDIRKGLAFTTKIDGLKKKSEKITAEIHKLEKQSTDDILSPECDYVKIRSLEHEITRLKKLNIVIWEQISNNISLMKAEMKASVREDHSRELQWASKINGHYSSSTPPARQIRVNSGDHTNEEGRSNAKYASVLTHEPQQSEAILQSNDSQGTASVGRIQDKMHSSFVTRTECGVRIEDGGPQSKGELVPSIEKPGNDSKDLIAVDAVISADYEQGNNKILNESNPGLT